MAPIKDMCLHGHDVRVVGRSPGGRCRECTRRARRRAYAENPAHHQAMRKPSEERARQNTQAWLGGIKLERGCAKCGYKDHPAALHFHHIDPSAKSFGLAHAGTRAYAAVLAEVDKCIILCANCHAVTHCKES